jgi:E3 ubiquitin-protein ligase HECTD2
MASAPWPSRSDSYRPPGVYAPPTPDRPPPPPPSQPVALRAGSTPSNSRAGAAATRPTANGSRRAINAAPMTPFEVLDDTQLDISTSSDEDQHPPSRPSRPQHGRNLSYPFPLLFSNKKKPPPPTYSDSDSSDGISPPLANSTSRSRPPRTHARMGPTSGSRDFTSGTCMTCGSLVRWPRELHVFRCVICMTINDLQPLATDCGAEHPTTSERAGPDDSTTLPAKCKSNCKICLGLCCDEDALSNT